MKNYLSILTAAILCFGLIPGYSQFGQMPRGPRFDSAMAKLFGDNSAFSATSETEMKSRNGDAMTMPGKIFFDSGKTRFEMNMADMKNAQMPPNAIEQMKSMGMDRMIMISRPDKKVSYMIYPGLQSYAEMPLPDAQDDTTNKFKVDTTELGKETVDGHPCIKNDVVVTDKEGNKHESTVWNATDLKNFPVKISHNEAGNDVSISFKEVALQKPDSNLFEPPSDYTRYDNVQTMMREQMMKHMGGQGFPPPAH